MSRRQPAQVPHDGVESDVSDATPRMDGSGGERPRRQELARVRPPLPPAPPRPQQTQQQQQQQENQYSRIQQTAIAPLQIAAPLPPLARPPERNRSRAPRIRTNGDMDDSPPPLPQQSRRQPGPERTVEGGEGVTESDSTPLLARPRGVPLSAYYATAAPTTDRNRNVASRPRADTNVSYRSDDEASCASVSSRTSFTLNYGLFKNLRGSLLPSNTELVAGPMSRRSTMSPGGNGGGEGRTTGGYYSDDDESFYSSASSSSYSSTTNGTGTGTSSPRRYLKRDVGEKRSQHSHESRREQRHNHHRRHNNSQHSRPHQHHVRVRRGLRRRIFLLLTEPQSSIVSAVFFILLIVLIAASNVVMMMQTMNRWQFTPNGCDFCGNGDPTWSDDNINTAAPIEDDSVPCECPPQPVPGIVFVEDALIYFFTVEWSLRVLCFVPPVWEQAKAGTWRSFWQWLSYLSDSTVVLDALAIFPYYLERFEKTNGLLSLRLLRLFRVFQLLRLGQYNVTFTTLSNVLMNSILSLNVLLIVLIFGAAFFGSIIYWIEKGEWKYTDYTDPPSFMFMRISADGVTDEPSPFVSIPSSFWWFIVTATTVGYGDVYPTSVSGKLVAGAAMLIGVLVIAFPVSVFSDLWSKELKKRGALVIVESSESLTDLVGQVEEKPLLPVDIFPTTNDGTVLSKELLHLAAEKAAENRHDKLSLAADVVDMCKSKDVSSHAVAGGMMLTQTEVQSISCHLERIDEAQREIRKILNGSRRLGDCISSPSP